MKYARVITVEAVQWDGYAGTLNGFIEHTEWCFMDPGPSIYVGKRDSASEGDWVVKDAEGNLSVWKNDEFRETFTMVDE